MLFPALLSNLDGSKPATRPGYADSWRSGRTGCSLPTSSAGTSQVHRGTRWYADQNWGQLGLTGEWADKPIKIDGIKPWNGYEEFVRQRVTSTPYAIGYTGAAYLDAPVKVLSFSNHNNDPIYAPTYDNIASASYPLSRLIYLNLNKRPDAPMDPVFAELTRFILSKQGQQKTLDQGIFLPLRGFQADASYPLPASHRSRPVTSNRYLVRAGSPHRRQPQ